MKGRFSLLANSSEQNICTILLLLLFTSLLLLAVFFMTKASRFSNNAYLLESKRFSYRHYVARTVLAGL